MVNEPIEHPFNKGTSHAHASVAFGHVQPLKLAITTVTRRSMASDVSSEYIVHRAHKNGAICQGAAWEISALEISKHRLLEPLASSAQGDEFWNIHRLGITNFRFVRHIDDNGWTARVLSHVNQSVIA